MGWYMSYPLTIVIGKFNTKIKKESFWIIEVDVMDRYSGIFCIIDSYGSWIPESKTNWIAFNF